MTSVFTAMGRSTGVGLISSLALALAGCSTIHGLSGAPHAGYQEDGTYTLSPQAQSLGCRDLQERNIGLQEKLQALPQQAVEQMQKLPDTVVAAWGRMVGSPAGAPALEELKKARAEQAAVNESLAKNGCGSVETAAINR